MATWDDVDQALNSMKIVSLIRFRGGTAQDRSGEMKKLHRNGEFHPFYTKIEGIESAVWLYKGLCKDPNAVEDIDWNRICELTKLGNDLGYRSVGIITLPDPFDATYTTYEVSKDQLVINLLPAFFKERFEFPVHLKGEKSLQWIVEAHARHACVINWPEGAENEGPTCLPHLPNTVNELELCGMPKIFRTNVPWRDGRDGRDTRGHWVHEFVQNLREVKILTFSGSDQDPECLLRLKGWTGQLCIKDGSGREIIGQLCNKDESGKESIEIDKRDDGKKWRRINAFRKAFRR
ncbi:hypothetical protein BU24DRAFT_413494 [Aaosphaeria arxii CBS 175.79]|uniref:Uncharacterized protein n=1 Tax=Aaosphaeria arxii CBS 175.79 TaxID=1450172 RepID=A0A6A5XCX0_9PLEO|nr:uncharacterized protein BU24DRAFT_413494 [Aaosphaeria arxii CBS 175.79]KAF2010770.1 hypothetical protein BU24DRAFT_413494 [Aaosphaeria arxii CBS 175.79]